MSYAALNALPVRTPSQQAALNLAQEASADIKQAVLKSAHTLGLQLAAKCSRCNSRRCNGAIKKS